MNLSRPWIWLRQKFRHRRIETDAFKLSRALQRKYPYNASAWIQPKSDSVQEFINELQRRCINAGIASGRDGTAGNPYQDQADDLRVIVSAAYKLSGIKPPWENLTVRSTGRSPAPRVRAG